MVVWARRLAVEACGLDRLSLVSRSTVVDVMTEPKHSRFALWWWRFRNPTRRHVWRESRPEDCPMWRRYVAVKQRQVREPFGEWQDDGDPVGYNGVKWPAERWKRFERGELIEYD